MPLDYAHLHLIVRVRMGIFRFPGWFERRDRMAMGIHFDTEDFDFEQDTLGIGIGHREDGFDFYDGDTLGIGIGHPEEKNQPLKEH